MVVHSKTILTEMVANDLIMLIYSKLQLLIELNGVLGFWGAIRN